MNGELADIDMKHARLIIALSFFAATFALSGYWIVTNPQQPLPDPTLYEGIAANLAAGNGYSFDLSEPFLPELTRTPFLPYLISMLYRVIGRQPEAVLWMNAIWIGIAVALGYLLALRLFKSQAAAIAGGIIAFATPPVTGASNNILTEPFAMVQLTLGALLLLDWPRRMVTGRAPLHAALLGLLFASTVLNRTAMTPLVLLAAAYVVLINLKGRRRLGRAWLNAVVFTLILGIPVIAWSARNASVGLSFSPAPVGLYASRVFDMKRYDEQLLLPGERLPLVNRQYFLHWKKHYGPKQILALEKKNESWFKRWQAKHSDRIVRAMPARLLGLFSFFRSSVFPPWPIEKDQEMREVMRWISRALWLLSLAGLALSWKNRPARYIWLAPVLTIVIMHVPTVCHERYAFPLLPLLMPYGGVALAFAYRQSIGRIVTTVKTRRR